MHKKLKYPLPQTEGAKKGGLTLTLHTVCVLRAVSVLATAILALSFYQLMTIRSTPLDLFLFQLCNLLGLLQRYLFIL